MPAMKTILRPPASRVLRYGDPDLIVTPTASVHQAEPLRYGRESAPSLTGDLRELAAIIVDAICELPWARWAASKMASEADAGDRAGVAVEAPDAGGNVPAPAGMKKRASKIESEAPPVKYSIASARSPSENTWSGLPRSQPPTSPRSTPAVAVAVADDKRSRYSRLLTDAADRSIDFATRSEAIWEARQLHAEHVDSSRSVADAAVRRATREGITFDAALRSEQQRAGAYSLPLPPSHVA